VRLASNAVGAARLLAWVVHPPMKISDQEGTVRASHPRPGEGPHHCPGALRRETSRSGIVHPPANFKAGVAARALAGVFADGVHRYHRLPAGVAGQLVDFEAARALRRNRAVLRNFRRGAWRCAVACCRDRRRLL